MTGLASCLRLIGYPYLAVFLQALLIEIAAESRAEVACMDRLLRPGELLLPTYLPIRSAVMFCWLLLLATAIMPHERRNSDH